MKTLNFTPPPVKPSSLLKAERQGLAFNKPTSTLLPSAVIADSFVKTAETTGVRNGLSFEENAKAWVTSALILLAMSPLLFVLASIGAKADYDFNKKVIKDAIAESETEQNRQLLPKAPQKAGIRNGEALSLTAVFTWITKTAIPAIATDLATTGVKYPSAKVKEDAAAALEKLINARDGQFQQESLALQREAIAFQKELTIKLEKAFSEFTQRKQLFTPQAFDTIVLGLGLPADKTDALRRLANQTIISVNDTKAEKAIHNSQVGYGLNQLMHARDEQNPADKLRSVQLGIRAIETALPDVHAMVRYQAHNALADLRAEEAKAYRLVGNEPEALEAESLAYYHSKIAGREGELSHFAAGFLEGLIDNQNEQFTPTQLRDLKRLLNAVAVDVRPLALTLKKDLERKQILYSKREKVLSQQEALTALVRDRDYLRYDEMFFRDARTKADANYTPNTFLDGLFGKSEETKRHEAYWENWNERVAKGNQAQEDEQKLVADHNELIRQSPIDLYTYLNQLAPVPQTYAEELPHRPKLRQLGVQFEPYPNA